jgi:RNA polymerase sigma-70 factor (ECF subfamily)
MRSGPSAEHVLLHGGIDAALVEAPGTLPEHYRMAVELCHVQGLSYAEIAQQMDCALGTVMSRLHRGARYCVGRWRSRAPLPLLLPRCRLPASTQSRLRPKVGRPEEGETNGRMW